MLHNTGTDNVPDREQCFVCESVCYTSLVTSCTYEIIIPLRVHDTHWELLLYHTTTLYYDYYILYYYTILLHCKLYHTTTLYYYTILLYHTTQLYYHIINYILNYYTILLHGTTTFRTTF